MSRRARVLELQAKDDVRVDSLSKALIQPRKGWKNKFSGQVPDSRRHNHAIILSKRILIRTSTLQNPPLGVGEHKLLEILSDAFRVLGIVETFKLSPVTAKSIRLLPVGASGRTDKGAQDSGKCKGLAS